MERSEPVLVPEWYRTGGVGSSSNSYRHYPSSSSSSDRSSNYSHHRKCDNGSMAYDKYTSTRSRTYSNFNNRGYHDRSREKNLDYSDRKVSILTDRYCYCSDISSSSRNEKDSLLRSQTMVSGRPFELMLKRHVNGLNNGGFPGNSAKGIQNSSFDKDFPSLGSVSVAPSTKNGINMAEALAKPPLRTRTSFQSSVNTQRLEGLATKHSKQLITLAAPKVPVWSKAKGTRTASMLVLPKLVPQSSSQSDKNPNLANPKSDVTKAYNDANFLVLNREKDVSVPSFDKITGPMTTNKVVNPVTASSDSPHKLKMEMIQNSTTEKRHFSQDRISFFNTIRNGSSANISYSASQEHDPVNSYSTLNKSGDHTVIANASTNQLKEPFMLDFSSASSMININGVNRKFNSLVDHENIAKVEESASCLDYPNEEEKNFLKSLGWQEDGGDDDALTAEEIDAFIREYKLGHLLKTDV